MNKKTEIYLNEIAEQLWNNKASLFVGAGFSRNAISKSDIPIIPLWSGLGDLFFTKVNGRKPKSKDKAYANVLKLAEDVEHVFGRTTLDSIISEAIADKYRTPSEIYSEILSLPWLNVYTTNYDTLLERAADSLEQSGRRSYSKVLNDKALSVQSSPYIAKLHGSITNLSEQIIITEEDYRLYPSKHPLFVNDVCNSFVRTTMVMIGFSGEDPNFNQWLGWVNDKLGKSARKVYLVAVEKMPDARVKTLESKNVIVLNISGMLGSTSSVSEDIKALCSYLDSYRPQPTAEESAFSKMVLSWGRDNHNMYSSRETDYMKMYKLLKTQRDSYPGWLLLPREKREYWASADSFSLSKSSIEALKKPYDLLYLEQFNWLMEKCLFPICNEWEPIYLSVIGKYQPTRANSSLVNREAWLNLKIALLRLYRQEAWEEKWQSLYAEMERYLHLMTVEQYASYMYEVCLHFVYVCDFAKLEAALKTWKKNLDIPYWEIKKASLLAEYISLGEGKSLAREAFDVISSKFETCSYKEKYYWASRKAYAHTILNLMCSANFSFDEDYERPRAQETWSTLKNYNDIWYESEFFDTKLRWAEEVFRVHNKWSLYELGRSRITSSMSNNSGDYRIAYAYFCYYEELGYPIHLPHLTPLNKDTLAKAVSVMSYCSPMIAENWVRRFGDTVVVDAMFNRKRLEQSSAEEVSALYAKYLGYANDLVALEGEAEKSWQQSQKSVSIRILSRLCLKASYDLRVETFDLIDKIYASQKTMSYTDVDSLVKMLMLSFSSKEKCSLLSIFIKLSVGCLRKIGDYSKEPMSFMPDKFIGNRPDIDSSCIDLMISAVRSNDVKRQAYITRLSVLFRYGLLSENQIISFADALWAVRDSSGFPDESIYSKFVFLILPHPNDVDPVELLRQYFSSTHIPFNESKKSTAFFGNVQILNEIKGTTNEDVEYDWRDDEIERLIDQIYEAWSHDKDLLLSEERQFGISAKDEYGSRFIDIGKIIIGVIAPHINKVNQNSATKLKAIIDEYAQYGLPDFSIKKAFPLWYSSEDINERFLNLASTGDEHMYADLLASVIRQVRCGFDVSNEIDVISDNFRCGKEDGLVNTIDILGLFTDKYQHMLTTRILQKIILGLDVLWEHTNIDKTDSELIVNTKLYRRERTAKIVKSLLKFEFFRDCDVLIKWREYYESKETFLDIQAVYADS